MRQAEGSKRYKLRALLHPSQSLPPVLLPLPRPATSALLSEFVQEAEEAWPGDGGVSMVIRVYHQLLGS